MKNKLLLLFIAVLAGSYLFAGEVFSAKPDTVKTMKGKVGSLVIDKDLMAGNRSELTIVNEKGDTVKFEVRTGIGVTVAGSGSNRAIALSDVKNGDIVAVDYMTSKEGVNKILTLDLFRYQGK